MWVARNFQLLGKLIERTPPVGMGCQELTPRGKASKEKWAEGNPQPIVCCDAGCYFTRRRSASNATPMPNPAIVAGSGTTGSAVICPRISPAGKAVV